MRSPLVAAALVALAGAGGASGAPAATVELAAADRVAVRAGQALPHASGSATRASCLSPIQIDTGSDTPNINDYAVTSVQERPNRIDCIYTRTNAPEKGGPTLTIWFGPGNGRCKEPRGEPVRDDTGTRHSTRREISAILAWSGNWRLDGPAGWPENVIRAAEAEGAGEPCANGPKVEPQSTRFFRSKVGTINFRQVQYVPKVAIVRHGTRVRFCNRDPIFHKPFVKVPGSATPIVTLAIRPRRCVFYFERLFAPNGKFLKRLKTQIGARVARRQIKQGFDPRTGRLLSPRRKGKLGVCWKFFDEIHADEAGAIWVLPKGKKSVNFLDRKAVAACLGGGARIEWPPKGA